MFLLLLVFAGQAEEQFFDQTALPLVQVPAIAADLGLDRERLAQVAAIYSAALDEAAECVVDGDFDRDRWRRKRTRFSIELAKSVTDPQRDRLAQLCRQSVGWIGFDWPAWQKLAGFTPAQTAAAKELRVAANTRPATAMPRTLDNPGPPSQIDFEAEMKRLVTVEQANRVFGERRLPPAAFAAAPLDPEEAMQRRVRLDRNLRPFGDTPQQFLCLLYAPGVADGMGLPESARKTLDELVKEALTTRRRWEAAARNRQPDPTYSEIARDRRAYWNRRVDAAVGAELQIEVRRMYVAIRKSDAIYDQPICGELGVSDRQIKAVDQLIRREVAAPNGIASGRIAALTLEMLTPDQRLKWARLQSEKVRLDTNAVQHWLDQRRDVLGMPRPWKYLSKAFADEPVVPAK